jgi:hypothetical protein
MYSLVCFVGELYVRTNIISFISLKLAKQYSYLKAKQKLEFHFGEGRVAYLIISLPKRWKNARVGSIIEVREGIGNKHIIFSGLNIFHLMYIHEHLLKQIKYRNQHLNEFICQCQFVT